MKCYLIAVALGSSLDKDTNNWSLFNLIEQFDAAEFPALLPFETMVFFEFKDDEIGREYDLRLVVEQGTVEKGSSEMQPKQITASSSRLRVRMRGISVPEPGEFHAFVEWRPSGEEGWSRSPIGWPLRAGRMDQTSGEKS